MTEAIRQSKVIVLGADEISEVPGIAAYQDRFEFVCAPDDAALAAELPGADVLLGWNFRNRALAECWHMADALKWIHWGAAGVDSALFPDLVESDVILTNSRGLFDRPIAEFVLAYMLSENKQLPTSLKLQEQKRYKHRFITRLAGQKAVVYGVGNIGRAIARLLTAVGVSVCGVGRSHREGDEDFGTIYGADEKLAPLGDADWAVGILPGTPATSDYFDEAFFAAMRPQARFLNLGRGTAVVDEALIDALESGKIAGALLDVFREEPLPETSPLWETSNLTISPHHSGDYVEYPADIAKIFFDNLERFTRGEPLNNVVDKKLGFVP